MTALNAYSPVYVFANPALGRGDGSQAPSKVSILATKVNQFFIGKGIKRITDDERVLLKNSMGIAHTTSRGYHHRSPGPIQENAELLLELTIDMKDVIFNAKGMDPRAVKDFQIHLEDRTCTYTEPSGKKVVIDLKKEDLPANLKELSALYFQAAEPFFVQRYRYDQNSSPLNGAMKIAASKPEITKLQSPFLDKSLPGFESARRLFAHYMVTHEPGAHRDAIMNRFAFCYYMQEHLTNELDTKIKEKEAKLPATNVPKEKKQLEADIAKIKEMKAELEEMDYFAIAVTLGYFPDTSTIKEDVGQMELTLQDKIADAKEKAETELKAQYALVKEERYIQENCMGLFHLTRHAQLEHARKLGIDNMPKQSMENVFVRDALLFHNDYKGEGFKNYFLAKVANPELIKELGVVFKDVGTKVATMIDLALVGGVADDILLTPNSSVTNPDVPYVAARRGMIAQMNQVLDEVDRQWLVL